MARKRDGLVPIGEVFGGLDGPVKAIRDASPQAMHHFTQVDQVNQLVEASEADPDMGFMARLMALCSLPRTNPGNRLQYKRVNGPYTLIMSVIGNNKLPYGSLPRLLLAWVCTEAVRTQSREIVLGRSLSEFMRKLDLHTSGGSSRGDRTRLRNQIKRLFHCTVSLIYEDERVAASASSLVADRTEFWWNERKPNEPVLFNSKIRLGEDFFNEIIRHPVPLDMNTLKALKRCSLGLDLYLWLVYRTFALRTPLRLSWRQLYRQFGVDPAKASDNQTVQNFRYKILRELKKIKLAWTDLNYSTAKGVLILSPSTPAIPAAGAVPSACAIATAPLSRLKARLWRPLELPRRGFDLRSALGAFCDPASAKFSTDHGNFAEFSRVKVETSQAQVLGESGNIPGPSLG